VGKRTARGPPMVSMPDPVPRPRLPRAPEILPQTLEVKGNFSERPHPLDARHLDAGPPDRHLAAWRAEEEGRCAVGWMRRIGGGWELLGMPAGAIHFRFPPRRGLDTVSMSHATRCAGHPRHPRRFCLTPEYAGIILGADDRAHSPGAVDFIRQFSQIGSRSHESISFMVSSFHSGASAVGWV
jgi:hypothetical protein